MRARKTLCKITKKVLVAVRPTCFTSPHCMTLSEELRALLRDTDKPILRIAREADVSYDKLWGWINGRTQVLDADMANAVVAVLKGEVEP